MQRTKANWLRRATIRRSAAPGAPGTQRVATGTRRRGGIALVLVAALVWCASAEARPSLSFGVPSQVTAGAVIPATWVAKGVRLGSQLVLQRQEGTARTWRTVARLGASHGSVTLGGLPLGSYRLRLAVLVRRRVLAERQALILSFGRVPLSTLFPNALSHGVYTTPTTSYAFEGNRSLIDGNNGIGALSPAHNPCRSVFIEFMAGLDLYFPQPAREYEGTTATLTVVQQSSDPVGATAPLNSVASLTAGLTPGQSWSVNLTQTAEKSFTFYLNGYAECDAASRIES